MILVVGPRRLVGGWLGRVVLRSTPRSSWGGGIRGILLSGAGLALAWPAVRGAAGVFLFWVSSPKRRRGLKATGCKPVFRGLLSGVDRIGEQVSSSSQIGDCNNSSRLLPFSWAGCAVAVLDRAAHRFTTRSNRAVNWH